MKSYLEQLTSTLKAMSNIPEKELEQLFAAVQPAAIKKKEFNTRTYHRRYVW